MALISIVVVNMQKHNRVFWELMNSEAMFDIVYSSLKDCMFPTVSAGIGLEILRLLMAVFQGCWIL